MATIYGKTTPADMMTYEEFIDWAGEDVRAEWVKGRVVEFMPPTDRHQSLLAWLVTLFSVFLEHNRSGDVLPAPFEMKLDVVPSSRQPDIIVSLASSAGRRDGKRLNGAADLAVEIISDDSVTRDRRDKFAEYALGGVSEYWIIDPRIGRYSFQAYQLADEDYYVPIPADDSGRIASNIIRGLRFDPAWIGRTPLPKAIGLFLAMVPDGANATEN